MGPQCSPTHLQEKPATSDSFSKSSGSRPISCSDDEKSFMYLAFPFSICYADDQCASIICLSNVVTGKIFFCLFICLRREISHEISTAVN